MMRCLLLVSVGIHTIQTATAVQIGEADSYSDDDYYSNSDGVVPDHCSTHGSVFGIALMMDASNCYRVKNMLFVHATDDEMKNFTQCVKTKSTCLSSRAGSIAACNDAYSATVPIYDCKSNALTDWMGKTALKTLLFSLLFPPLGVAVAVVKAAASTKALMKALEDKTIKGDKGDVPETSWKNALLMDETMIAFLKADQQTDKTADNMDKIMGLIKAAATKAGNIKSLRVLIHWTTD